MRVPSAWYTRRWRPNWGRPAKAALTTVAAKCVLSSLSIVTRQLGSCAEISAEISPGVIPGILSAIPVRARRARRAPVSSFYLWLSIGVAGLALLAFGAKIFIDGAADGARRSGISPMLVGLFLAGFATSLPEAVVAAVAALRGSVELALGNAMGSNIANIGLVLGAGIMFMGLRPGQAPARAELWAMVGVTALACLLISNGYLSRLDALALLAALPALSWLLIQKTGAAQAASGSGTAGASQRSIARNAIYAGGGLALLLAGAEALVRAAQEVARIAGVSELVIGATVVAIGTSLPELAITVAGAIKRESEIALGNVIGSNIFNLLVVVGVAGMIAPAGFPSQLLTLHVPMLLGFTFWFVFLAALCRWRNGLGRAWSATLLLPFASYIALAIALGS